MLKALISGIIDSPKTQNCLNAAVCHSEAIQKNLFLRCVLTMLICLLSSIETAAVPNKINYQGRYTVSGVPQNGTKVFVFKIFDGAVEKWTSGNMNVAVSTGLFSVELTPTGVDWGSLTDPKIEVTAEATVLSPQESLRSSVYALYASSADYAVSAGGGGWSDDGTVVRLTNTSDNVVIASTLTVQGNAFSVGASTLVVVNGNVGIGRENPTQRLDVYANSINTTSDFILSQFQAEQSVANTGNTISLYSAPAYTAASGNAGSITGILSVPLSYNSGTISSFIGIASVPTKSNTGAISSAIALYGRIDNNNAAGAITDAYGLYLATNTKTGAITNEYGVYQTGTGAINYFGGNVGIGTITPQSSLQVAVGYIQFPTISGAAPVAADCDIAAEAGRVVVRTDGATNLYICTGTGGWVGK